MTDEPYFDDSVCECVECRASVLADVDDEDAWNEAWAPMPIVTVPDVSTWEVP